MVFSWPNKNYLMLLPAMGTVGLSVSFHIVSVNHRQKGIKANRQLQYFTLSDVSRLIILCFGQLVAFYRPGIVQVPINFCPFQERKLTQE